MKTLVAQLWDDPETIGDYPCRTDEVVDFWYPCMATVESWAETNGWDYKRYTFAELEPLLPDLTDFEDILLTKWGRVCIAKIGIFNNTDYDKIVIIDADVWIHGNPQLGNAKFGIRFEDRWFPVRLFPLFTYVQGGVYYSTCGPEVYRWCVDQFTNPCQELEFMKLLYELMRKRPENVADFPNLNLHLKYGMTDETILCAYVNNHDCENIENHIYWSNEFPKQDSFIHMDGPNKAKKLEKLKALLIYQKVDKFWEQNLHKLKSKGIV